MQVRPFFAEYEELKRVPFIKDDKGTQYCLVKMRGKVVEKQFYRETISKDGLAQPQPIFPTLGVTKHYEGWIVLSDQLLKHGSGATSYDETLYWKQPKELLKVELEGLVLQEVFVGTNSFWPGATTMNTQFFISES